MKKWVVFFTNGQSVTIEANYWKIYEVSVYFYNESLPCLSDAVAFFGLDTIAGFCEDVCIVD